MRIAALLIAALAFGGLAGCHRRNAADKVEHYYDKKAAQMEAAAQQQPTKIGQKIYKARADAIRKEGEDREKGLRKAGAGAQVPRLSNIEESLSSAPTGNNAGR